MKRKTRFALSDYLTAAVVAAAGIGLLTNAPEVAKGVHAGLKICAGTLIPSLFPFMVLASFLSLSRAAGVLSAPLAPIAEKLLKLPGELGAVVLLSLVGGYPVGAKCIALLLSQNKIDRSTAERMLCFCVNSGPSFLISAVGAGMLMSETAGVVLFAAQTSATLLIGIAVSLRTKPPRVKAEPIGLGVADAFVMSVNTAASAMFGMCAFAILFSGLLRLVFAGSLVTALAGALHCSEAVVRAVISGFLEVTSGCAAAAQLGGNAAFALICATVSFGGLSVLFQIMSCFRETPIRFKSLILARISHILISTAIALPLYSFFCGTQTVFAPSGQPNPALSPQTALLSACLLCMCAVLTLSGQKRY